MLAAEAILWDVADEHLDEAGYAFARWRAALASPSYRLDELARGPEERLFAHIDGLLVAGAPVAERLLRPELTAPEDPTFERSIVAALVMLASGAAGQDLVWSALGSKDSIVASAAREAFVLAGDARLDAWLPAQLAPGALLDIAARRGLALPDVTPILASARAPTDLAAAAIAARRCDPARHLPAVERLLDHADRGVREAALVTALTFGSAFAWQRCVAFAADARRPDRLAMLLVALVGDPRQHAVLVDHLARRSHRAAALAALAWCGQAAVVPSLLPFVADADPAIAALAAFAVATITGIETPAGAPPAEAEGLPDIDDDDLDAYLVPPVETELPPPDAAAVHTAWTRVAPTLDARRRLLAGVPWTLAAALDRFESTSLYARAPLALWLLVRTGGVARVDTQAWSSVQRQQAAAARRLSESALVRRFGSW